MYKAGKKVLTMKFHSHIQNQKGFSLVEVLAAIVIITVVLFSFLTLIPHAMRTVQSNILYEKNVYAANNVLNYLKNENFNLFNMAITEGKAITSSNISLNKLNNQVIVIESHQTNSVVHIQPLDGSRITKVPIFRNETEALEMLQPNGKSFDDFEVCVFITDVLSQDNINAIKSFLTTVKNKKIIIPKIQVQDKMNNHLYTLVYVNMGSSKDNGVLLAGSMHVF